MLRICVGPVTVCSYKPLTCHLVLLFRAILWFGPRRSHSSVPTRTMVRPSRAAAVKDGPILRPPGGLVLDGREHGGRLVCVGNDAAADAGARSRSARDIRSRSGGGADCRTPRHKTHSTAAGDEIAVAYSWHPWAGRTVRIHEVIERATGASARCSLVDAAVARVQEIPVWMLDAAACRQTRLGGAAGCGVVRACGIARPALGSDAAAATEAPSDAGIASPDSYRGDRHATPSSPAPTAAPSTRPLAGEPLPMNRAERRDGALCRIRRSGRWPGLLTRLLVAHAGAARELDGQPGGRRR